MEKNQKTAEDVVDEMQKTDAPGRRLTTDRRRGGSSSLLAHLRGLVHALASAGVVTCS